MLALAPLVAVKGARLPDFGPRFAPTHKDNMNGAYPFSATPGGTPGKMPKRFSDYPHGVESFDVHTSEMSTLYSQVEAPPAVVEAPPARRAAERDRRQVQWQPHGHRRLGD